MDAISASVGMRLVGLTVQTLMNRMPILLGWCFAVISNIGRTALKRIDMKRIFSVRASIEFQSSGSQRETARRKERRPGRAST
jgi:hypothetical protein